MLKKLVLLPALFATFAFADGPCDQSPWAHVKDPKRLHVVAECITVRGYLERKVPNPVDGDYHLNIRLDPEYLWALNARNRKSQGGLLVTEPVCALWPGRLREHCKGYKNPFPIPARGAYVEISGAYVQDGYHGWMEIHPIMSIKVLEVGK